jgi:hypothetical protein
VLCRDSDLVQYMCRDPDILRHDSGGSSEGARLPVWVNSGSPSACAARPF